MRAGSGGWRFEKWRSGYPWSASPVASALWFYGLVYQAWSILYIYNDRPQPITSPRHNRTTTSRSAEQPHRSSISDRAPLRSYLLLGTFALTFTFFLSTRFNSVLPSHVCINESSWCALFAVELEPMSNGRFFLVIARTLDWDTAVPEGPYLESPHRHYPLRMVQL